MQSSDNSIASVNSHGLVSGVSIGSATITVTTNDGSLTDSCVLNFISFVETQNLIKNGDLKVILISVGLSQ